MGTKKKTEYLHMRISEGLKEELREKAEKEGRTLSNHVEHVLRQSLMGESKES